jgi:hypothetical protein
MANSNLRKIILEELHKVLNEQGVDTPFGSSEKVSMGPAPSAKVAPKKVGDPKVKKLQNLLASVGLNVGKIDGIPGPLLYKAISQVAQVPEQRVAKDFASSGPNAADNYVTAIGPDPQKLAALRKSNVKREAEKATAPIDAVMKPTLKTDLSKPVSATGNLPIDSEIPPSGLPTVKSSVGAGVEKIPGTEKKSFTRNPEATKINTKKEEAPVDTSKIGVKENLRKELVRMLKNL